MSTAHGKHEDELAQARLVDRMEQGIPPESVEEAEARKPYERIAADLRDMPSMEPPAGWQERVLAQAAKRRQGRILSGFFAAAAIAAVALIVWRYVTPPPESTP